MDRFLKIIATDGQNHLWFFNYNKIIKNYGESNSA